MHGDRCDGVQKEAQAEAEVVEEVEVKVEEKEKAAEVTTSEEDVGEKMEKE